MAHFRQVHKVLDHFHDFVYYPITEKFTKFFIANTPAAYVIITKHMSGTKI